MISMLNRGARAAVLAIALLALGCESSTEPTPRTTTLEAESPDRLLGGLIGGLTGILSDGLRLVSTVVAVVEDLGSALIGPTGGLLEVQDHDLLVPPGAMPHPAQFTMTVLGGRTVEVDLQALDPETGENVGAKGFNVPVQLSLSYADTDLSSRQARKLVIVRILEDGTRVPLPSTVDTETKQVTAELDHFSRYGLCRN